jgi:hypothetical protein
MSPKGPCVAGLVTRWRYWEVVEALRGGLGEVLGIRSKTWPGFHNPLLFLSCTSWPRHRLKATLPPHSRLETLEPLAKRPKENFPLYELIL